MIVDGHGYTTTIFPLEERGTLGCWRVFLQGVGRKKGPPTGSQPLTSSQGPAGLGIHNSWGKHKRKEATKEMSSPV